MALFEVNQVSFHYGAREALHRIDLRIEAGERLALLGSNGSGKSTLLRLLDGLHLPASGSIDFDGERLTEEWLSNPKTSTRFRRRVGLLFQDPDVQLFNPTVFDEIAFGPLQLGWTREETISGVEEALRLLDIAHLRDRAPYQLSGGEKKRVALASVFAVSPEVLLLDEPGAALDPKSYRQLISFLQAIPATTTLITATHDLHTVQEIAETCCVLNQGKVLARSSAMAVLGDDGLLRLANLK